MSLPKNKPLIAIYADRASKASPSPLDREMARSFGDHVTIENVGMKDILKPSLYDNMMMFVLPGIEGETSFYHEHIGPANDLIRDYIANGGGFFGQCGGACYAAERTLFTPEWNAHRKREAGLLHLFNGVAHGPVPGLGVDGEDPNYYRGLTSANIVYDDGEFQSEMPAVYTSGPTFLPHDGQDMNILARYKDRPDRPPAMISLHYGKGLVILSGPVPQNGSTPHAIEMAGYTKLNELFDRIRPYEQTRIRLFDHLMSKFRNHYDTIHSRDLRIAS